MPSTYKACGRDLSNRTGRSASGAEPSAIERAAAAYEAAGSPEVPDVTVPDDVALNSAAGGLEWMAFDNSRPTSTPEAKHVAERYRVVAAYLRAMKGEP